MSLTLILALQAAAPAAAAPIPIDFDLARVRPTPFDLAAMRGSAGCRRDGAGAILVCGRRPGGGAFPFAEMARRYAVGPIVAETGLGGGARGSLAAEAVALDRGAVSNRAMVRIRLPF